MEKKSKKSITASFAWKLLERFSFHGVKLLIQIILARILFPSDFGLLGIIMVFVEFATIFVQSGLNTALIQNGEVDENDFSTVFWFSTLLALVLYLVLFFASPAIAFFYNNTAITVALRVLGIYLFGGAFNSIQIAYATKKFDFKSQFIGNFISITISGCLGIYLALNGAGIWALIIQQLVWQFLCCIIMFFFIRWRPRFVFDGKRLKPLLSFGWKMLLSSVLMRSKSLISNLVIGKKYNEEELGHYTKAQNFPVAFSDVVVNTFSSISLADLSKTKDDLNASNKKLLLYIEYSTLVVTPALIGLFATSTPFIHILLSDKWLPCVPYLQMFCLIQLFQPICAIFGQALSAFGRSDLYLKTYLITEPLGLALVIGGSFVFSSPISIAWIMLVTQILETIILFLLVSKIYRIGLSVLARTWFTSLLPSVLMLVIIYPLQYKIQTQWLLFVTQVILGIAIYCLLVFLLKKEAAIKVINKIKKRGN